MFNFFSNFSVSCPTRKFKAFLKILFFQNFNNNRFYQNFILATRSDLRSVGSESSKSVVSKLTVIKVHDNSPMASTNFTFYDCHSLSTCTECASSRFHCDWCTLSNKCVPNAEDLCQGEPLVNAVSVSYF